MSNPPLPKKTTCSSCTDISNNWLIWRYLMYVIYMYLIFYLTEGLFLEINCK